MADDMKIIGTPKLKRNRKYIIYGDPTEGVAIVVRDTAV